MKEEVEEEETLGLGQLRDRTVLASAQAAVPGPRAPFVHIEVEDSTSGEETDGKAVRRDGEEATSAEDDVAGGEEKVAGQQHEQHA